MVDSFCLACGPNFDNKALCNIIHNAFPLNKTQRLIIKGIFQLVHINNYNKL